MVSIRASPTTQIETLWSKGASIKNREKTDSYSPRHIQLKNSGPKTKSIYQELIECSYKAPTGFMI